MFGFLKRIPFWAKIFAGFTIIIVVAVSLIYVIANDIIFARFDRFATDARMQQVRTLVPLLERIVSQRLPRQEYFHIYREITRIGNSVGEHILVVDRDGMIKG